MSRSVVLVGGPLDGQVRAVPGGSEHVTFRAYPWRPRDGSAGPLRTVTHRYQLVDRLSLNAPWVMLYQGEDARPDTRQGSNGCA